jgi:hypothetical protein
MKISVCMAKVLDLFLWHPFLVFVLGILDFLRKDAAPLAGQLGGEVAGGVFFHFPWSYGPSVTSGSCEVVSSDDQLMSSNWFLLSTGQVAIGI